MSQFINMYCGALVRVIHPLPYILGSNPEYEENSIGSTTSFRTLKSADLNLVKASMWAPNTGWTTKKQNVSI